jgi:hypothetical protein
LPERDTLSDHELLLLIKQEDQRAFDSIYIYGCTYAPAGFTVPDGKLVLAGYEGKIRYAQFLNDDSEIKYVQVGDDISLCLPVKKSSYEIPVIELVLP